MSGQGDGTAADRLAAMEREVEALGQALRSSLREMGSFRRDLSGLGSDMAVARREMSRFARAAGSGLRRAFEGLVFDGMKLTDALRLLGRAMADSVFDQALRPVQNAFGALLAEGVQALVGKSGARLFARGGVIDGGAVRAFARGGVVDRPTGFALRGGLGLMGEAGPEAILPLARGADGRLGVRAAGASRPVQVNINVTTPDVQGFRRSEAQIAARLGRLIGQGGRNG